MERPLNTSSTDKEWADCSTLMSHICGSKRLRVRRVKREEYVADLGTNTLSKAVIAKHCLTLGFADMAEENGKCKMLHCKKLSQ